MGMAVSVPKYTVDDLEQFPDDGNRYELLNGTLLVTPSPSAGHQNIAARLQHALSTALATPGYAHVVGPGAVSVPPSTQLLPDVLVYSSRFAPDLDWRKVTAHWLAVEVLSRSSRIYDREFKRDAYFALGVLEVWLIDPRDKSVEVCRRAGAGRVVRDVVRWRVPEVDAMVSVDLVELFAGFA